jgi:hypothetical protein
MESIALFLEQQVLLRSGGAGFPARHVAIPGDVSGSGGLSRTTTNDSHKDTHCFMHYERDMKDATH